MSHEKELEDLSGAQSVGEAGSAEPNLVTEIGARRIEGEVASLKDRLLRATDELDRSSLKKDLRYWETRRSSMEIVPGSKNASKVGFGVTTFIERDGKPEELSIVGEDEADPKVAAIAWTSDLAKAIVGSSAGDIERWLGKSAQRG